MFSLGFFSNPLILLGIAAELGLLLFTAYTPAGNWLFGTAPVGAEVWLVALALAVLMGGNGGGAQGVAAAVARVKSR